MWCSDLFYYICLYMLSLSIYRKPKNSGLKFFTSPRACLFLTPFFSSYLPLEISNRGQRLSQKSKWLQRSPVRETRVRPTVRPALRNRSGPAVRLLAYSTQNKVVIKNVVFFLVKRLNAAPWRWASCIDVLMELYAVRYTKEASVMVGGHSIDQYHATYMINDAPRANSAEESTKSLPKSELEIPSRFCASLKHSDTTCFVTRVRVFLTQHPPPRKSIGIISDTKTSHISLIIYWKL